MAAAKRAPSVATNDPEIMVAPLVPVALPTVLELVEVAFGPVGTFPVALDPAPLEPEPEPPVADAPAEPVALTP